MRPSPASPLAAPHSPIASAKRTDGSFNRISSTFPQPSVRTPERNKAMFAPDYLRKIKQEETNRRAQEAREARAREQASSSERDEVEQFNAYKFIKQLPRYESVKIANKVNLLPRLSSLSNKFTLVLDLDETLVHCSIEPIDNPDVTFPVVFNGVSYSVYVRKRPFLDFFLESVSKMFEVVVFTASQKVYAETLLDILDPEKSMISSRLFREACLCVQGNYIKDLGVLGRQLTRTVLVDNSPYAYGYQVDNGIPIESWYDDEKDTELLKLLSYLKSWNLANIVDVRPMIREQFKSHILVSSAR